MLEDGRDASDEGVSGGRGKYIPRGFGFGVAGAGFVAVLYLRFGGIVASVLCKLLVSL